MNNTFHKPIRTKVADMLNQPQMFAIEIKVERIHLKDDKEAEQEDIVVWVQVMDLPLMEMLPNQRELTNTYLDKDPHSSEEEADNVDVVSSELIGQQVRLSKKSEALVAGQPDINASDSDTKSKSSSKTKKSTSKTNKKKSKSGESKKSISHKNNDKLNKSELRKELKKTTEGEKPSEETDEIHEDNEIKGSEMKKLSFSETKQGAEVQLSQPSVELSFKRSSFKGLQSGDDESKDSKKFKLLTELLSSVPSNTEMPEGTAFKSDCCILIPVSSVSNALYMIEKDPITLNLIRTGKCVRLIGKAFITPTYCHQNSIVEAAKLKGGVVIHAEENMFPIVKQDLDSKTINVGNIVATVKFICYGSYGITEIKSPKGDLMVGPLKEYRSDYSQTDKVKEDERITGNPYGFIPKRTCDDIHPSQGFACSTKGVTKSMLNYVERFYTPLQLDPEKLSLI